MTSRSNERGHPILQEVRDAIAADYARNEMTTTDIARKHNVHEDTVRVCAKEAGVPMRKRGGLAMPKVLRGPRPIIVGHDPMDELTGIERLEVEYLRKLMERDARVWAQRKLKTERLGEQMIGIVTNADGQRCN